MAAKQPHTMFKDLSYLMYCVLFILLPACVHAQDSISGGLFPPLQFRTNFASLQTVEATSTCTSASSVVCGGGDVGGCTACNSTCPYGQDVPPFVDLLDTGSASSGVVRYSLY